MVNFSDWPTARHIEPRKTTAVECPAIDTKRKSIVFRSPPSGRLPGCALVASYSPSPFARVRQIFKQIAKLLLRWQGP